MLVKDVMSERIIFIRPQDSIQRAIMTMVKHDISGLTVVAEGKRLVGMLTMKDIFRKVLARDKDPKTTVVSDVMSSPVIFIHPLDTIGEAAETMAQKNIKRLVVVNSANVPTGIITAMDIVGGTPEMLDVMFSTWVKPTWR